jgi:hypothetical protein
MPESASWGVRWEDQGESGEWGRLELGGEGGGVEAGLPASVIRARAAQSAREAAARFGQADETSGPATRLPPGRRLVMVVDPPMWYAGFSGALAVVHAVGRDAVYVRFHTGPLESYPPGKFQEYFRPLA